MSLRKQIADYSQEEINDAYHSIFNSPKGRVVLLHLSDICHLDKTTYCFGDASETVRREGERRVILEILTRMNINVLDFINDTEEQTDDPIT